MSALGGKNLITPIFSLDGTVDEVELGAAAAPSSGSTSDAVPTSSTIDLGSLPDSAYQAQRGIIIRDHGLLAEMAEKENDRILMAVNPALARALDKKKKARAVVEQWSATVRAHEAEAAKLSNLVSRHSEGYEDFDGDGEALGDRRTRLAQALEQLREAREEFLASVEELEAAEANVSTAAGGK